MREREVVREREPVRDREVVLDRPVEHDVVYSDAPPRRGGGGGVIVAIVGILLVLLIGWFALRALNVMGDAADNGAELNVPDNVNVDVDE